VPSSGRKYYHFLKINGYCEAAEPQSVILRREILRENRKAVKFNCQCAGNEGMK
jgi:hypothetical protein